MEEKEQEKEEEEEERGEKKPTKIPRLTMDRNLHKCPRSSA